MKTPVQSLLGYHGGSSLACVQQIAPLKSQVPVSLWEASIRPASNGGALTLLPRETAVGMRAVEGSTTLLGLISHETTFFFA